MRVSRVHAALVVGALGLATPSLGFAQSWPSRARAIERELDAPRVEMRRAAVRRLGRVGAAEARRLIERALGDEDREVRLLAARRALELGFAPPLESVRPWLKDADVELRKAALSLLQIEPAEEALDDVTRLLVDPDKTVRALAARTLGRADPRFMTSRMPPLVAALRDADPLVRGEAAEALGRVGTWAATSPLASLIEDSDAEVRRRALVGLSAFADPSVQSALVSGLLDADESVKIAAASSLVRLGVSQRPLDLLSALDSTKGRARIILIEALGRGFSAESREAAKFLIGLVVQSEEREIAARALVAQGKQVLPFLNECFRKGIGAPVRLCARVFLEVGGDASLLDELVREGKTTRAELLDLFVSAPRLDEGAIVIALEALGHGDAAVRARALAVLSRTDVVDPAYSGPIRAAVSAPGWSVAQRSQLLSWLERDPSAASLELARRYLDSTDVRLRRSAARVLVAGKTPVEEIFRLLLDETTGEVVSEVLSKKAPAELELPLLDNFSSVGRLRRAWLLRAAEGLPSRELREGGRWTRLLREARGAERDRVIGLLESWGGHSHLPEDSVSWTELDLVWAAVEARTKADLSTHHILTSDRMPERVRALAWQSQARFDSFDVPRALEVLKKSSSRFERVAITFALARRVAQGARFEDTRQVCELLNETDPLLRLGAFELGRRLALPCVESAAIERLRHEPHPDVRRVLVRALSASRADAARRALGVVAAYEVDPSVAEAASSAPRPVARTPVVVSAEPAAAPEESRFPLVPILSEGSARAASTWILVEGDDELPVLTFTDRDGNARLPAPLLRLLDPALLD